MAKAPTLNDVTNILTSSTILNANWDAIQTAFENTLSLDGSTPNQMQADIDLNSNDLLNVGSIDAEELVIDGANINDIIAEGFGSLDELTTIKDEAVTAANQATSAVQAYITRLIAYADLTNPYTLPYTPADGARVDVNIDGVVQHRDQYTVVGDQLTFTGGWPVCDYVQIGIQGAGSMVNVGDTNVASFDTRAEAVTAVAAASTELDGRSLMFDGTVWYKYSSGATAISDLPDWLPAESITPMHFGATGDGSTDDTTAVQSASDYAASASSALEFPAGTYLLSAVVTLSTGSVWSGDGQAATLTKSDGGTYDLVNGISVDDIFICGLAFDGKRRNGGGVTGQSLRFRSCSNVQVTGCYLYDGMNIFIEEGCDGVIVDGNRFYLGKYGVGVGGYHNSSGTGLFATNVNITGNRIEATETEGVDLNYNVRRCVIDGNVLQDIHTQDETGNEAIDIGGGTHEDITVSNNVIDLGGYASSGINVKEASTRVSVTGNTITGGDITDAEGRGIRATGGSTDVVISGNVVEGVFRGISVDTGCSYVSVTGNTINAQDQAISVGGGSNLQISIVSNVIRTVAGIRDGIVVGDCDGFSITGNTVLGVTNQGIETQSTSTNGAVSGNVVTQCNDGINVVSPATVVDGNICFENDDKGIQVQADYVTLSNNISRDNGQAALAYGIRIEAGADFCIITGNQVYDTQSTKTQQGLSFGGACDRCIITSNMLYDNDSSVNITGTGSLTNAVISDNITS